MAETTTRRRTPLHSPQRNFFGQINVAFLNMTYYFSQQQQQQSTTSASCHAILAFIVPALLNFVQIKYQGKNEISPFDTHPKSVSVSIASLLLYCFAYDAELRSSASQSQQTYALIARRGRVLFGWLAVVPLASILLPYSLGPFLYSLFVLFSAGEFLRIPLQMLWKWLLRIIMGRLRPSMILNRLTAHL